ncbi:MAG TPA: hypothetical protein IAC28_09065 [Candidatus Aphodovivens excrementavium]|nr:hypothetical protein [Candidatus Aphodovivens excrementavium]
MKCKVVSAAIAAIACALALATGCGVAPHEDVTESDSATIEQSDKADSKDGQEDESDKTSDTESDGTAFRMRLISAHSPAQRVGVFVLQSSFEAAASRLANKPSGTLPLLFL